MRIWSLLLVGAAAFAGSSGAIAAPINGSAIAAAAEQVGVSENVHCRPFRHWHPWGWGRGCRGATIYYDYGPSYRYGYRHGHRWGPGGGFDVRTRERAGVTIQGGERRGFRGGGQAGEVSPRGSAGGQFRAGGGGQGGPAMSGGGRGPGGGGQMQSAPTGGGGGPAAGGGGGQGHGGGGGQGHGGGGERR